MKSTTLQISEELELSDELKKESIKKVSGLKVFVKLYVVYINI